MARRQAGFTMAELVIVMVLVGILAVFVMPKMQAAMGMQDESWRDQVVSALRYAQKTSVSHRRVVCVTVAGTSVSLRIASTNPTAGCDQDLVGPDGSATFATGASASTSVNPAGVIFCQPDGRVTTDAAGSTAASRIITVAGASRVITVHGETGFVE